jgi:hypothetical protein
MRNATPRNVCLLLLALGQYSLLPAQSRYFLGAMGGVATLSADARSQIGSENSGLSLYKPENGPTVQLFGGLHLADYLSLEADYVWNRNDALLTSLRATGGSVQTYQQQRDSGQHGVSADLLVYFRKRDSRVRPYLAIGLGAIRFHSAARSLELSSADFAPPPAEFTSTALAVRFPVGIDVALRRGWWIRYSFVETIRQNPLSARLSPPGQRRLAIYQNLFGFVKYF